MAKVENDREDLLAEATALVERAELHVAGFNEPIVAGFRRDGCGSIYFGAQPAYHFNTQNQLRRAYLGGLLYKADAGRMASLERQRTPSEVQLVRHDLSAAETAILLQELHDRLLELVESLASGAYRIAGQIPPERDLVAQISAWLSRLLQQPLQPADSPRVQ